MAGRPANMRDLLAPPVFDSDVKTSIAAKSQLLAWVELGLVSPVLVVLALSTPSIATLVWIATAGLVASSLFLLVATRLGYVEQAAVVFLVGVWALFSWAAWMSGGLFSAALCAQFLLVTLAEATHGWRWALAASALAVTTVVVFTWAEVHGLTPFSTVITTPASYAAVVIACLVALAINHGLIGAQARGNGVRVARELQRRTTAENRLRDLVDNAPFGAFLCELLDQRQLRVTHANRHASVALGKNATQFVGGDLGEVFAASASHDLIERFRAVAAGGDPLEDEIQVHSGGAKRTLAVHAYQTELNVIAVFFNDVTQQRLDETRIRQMAFHDELTKLPNRKLLLDRLAVAIEAARRRGSGVALLFIDLDDFKPLNDRYGHAFGDQVLSAVARRLHKTARASDTVARIGGDEFTVLMPDVTSREQAEVVAAKLVAAFGEPLSLGGKSVSVTASIGIALSEDQDIGALALLENADRAMYEVKRSGRNGFRVR
jgi:diguanylate cyclase (GGDEF)-like protein